MKHYGIYFLEESVPAHILQILTPKRETIKNEVLEYASNDDCPMDESVVDENLDIIFDQDKDIRNIILYDQMNNRNKLSPYLLLEKLNLNEEVMHYVNKCIWKRFLKVKKMIIAEIKDLDQKIKEEVKNGGKDICLDMIKNGKKLTIWIDKLKKQIVIEPSYDVKRKYKLSEKEFEVILNKLNFKEFSTMSEFDIDNSKKVSWFISGEYGIEPVVSNRGDRMPEEVYNNLVFIFEKLGVKVLLDMLI
ncbi:hypothetical protein [Clostridium thermarum]|uniref:hypothetical protein n=1 Tax=Clostridium thermarum TaxID=1716543 RepID=UPI001124A95F|nr:hypothetical protein [Clostridium thermarum]